ncbi:MAG: hypothetical protein WBE79_02610 [Candidatus Cybelea sp.]|jgi:hypothetical protein
MKNHWYALTCATVATLAGCGSSLQAGAPPATAAKIGGSWMAPAAKNTDLLYISDVGTDRVYAFSYPQGSLVGTLSGFNTPVRECSDTAGNLYVTNTNAENILEYAHGGSSPIATYHDKGFLPTDCSVDPASGSLAAANYGPKGTNRGNLAIFSGGKTTPKFYEDPSVRAYLFCGYDGSGNLFVDGLNDTYGRVFIELRKGAKKFEHIKLDQSFSGWGGVKWDGKYIAMSDGASTIFDFDVAGTKTKLVRTIRLKRAVNVVGFWIDASTLIGPDGPDGGHNDAGFWNYPEGRAPQKTIGSGLFKNPSAATISRAKQRL